MKKERTRIKLADKIYFIVLMLLLSFTVGFATLMAMHKEETSPTRRVNIITDKRSNDNIDTDENSLENNFAIHVNKSNLTLTKKEGDFLLYNPIENKDKFYLGFRIVSDGKEIYKTSDNSVVKPGASISVDLGKLLDVGRHDIEIYNIPYYILEYNGAEEAPNSISPVKMVIDMKQ